jgi:hypothetical protein
MEGTAIAYECEEENEVLEHELLGFVSQIHLKVRKHLKKGYVHTPCCAA